MGSWQLISVCDEHKAKCDENPAARTISFESDNVANFDGVHLTYRQKGQSLTFTMAGMAFDKEYEIQKLNSNRLVLLNKKNGYVENYERIFPE